MLSIITSQSAVDLDNIKSKDSLWKSHTPRSSPVSIMKNFSEDSTQGDGYFSTFLDDDEFPIRRSDSFDISTENELLYSESLPRQSSKKSECDFVSISGLWAPIKSSSVAKKLLNANHWPPLSPTNTEIEYDRSNFPSFLLNSNHKQRRFFSQNDSAL